MNESRDVGEMVIVVDYKAVQNHPLDQYSLLKRGPYHSRKIYHGFSPLVHWWSQGRIAIIGDVDVLLPVLQDLLQPGDIITFQACNHEGVSVKLRPVMKVRRLPDLPWQRDAVKQED